MKKMKNPMKKLLAILLTIAMFITMIPAVQAEAAIEDAKAEFRKILIEMLETGDGSKHNIYDLKLKFPEYNAIFEDVIHNECRLAYRCYINNPIQSEKDSDGYITNFWMYNSDEGFPERYAKVKEVLEYTHSQMDDKMTDLDKLLWLHEYLVKNTYYNNTGEMIVHSGSAPLALGYGVCDGYAKALQMLLEKEGIESEEVSSATHGWLAVKIDGEFYHVDPTWDDTRSTTRGTHSFLMRNDDEFLNATSSPHAEWTKYFEDENKIRFYTVSTSTKYTDWYVHSVKGEMFYYDGLWYYVQGNTIMRNNIQGTASDTVVEGSGLTISGIEDGNLMYTEGTETKTLKLQKNPDEESTTEPATEPTTKTPTEPEQQKKVSIKKCSFKVAKLSYTYNKKFIKPAVTVKYQGKQLIRNKDYKVVYQKNKKAGKAKIIITGKGKFKGSKSVSFRIKAKSLKKLKVTKIKQQKYTGKSLKPKVMIRFGTYNLRKNKDYTVVYKNNKKKGTGTAYIKGKGNYTGTLRLRFKIR